MRATSGKGITTPSGLEDPPDGGGAGGSGSAGSGRTWLELGVEQGVADQLVRVEAQKDEVKAAQQAWEKSKHGANVCEAAPPP